MTKECGGACDISHRAPTWSPFCLHLVSVWYLSGSAICSPLGSHVHCPIWEAGGTLVGARASIVKHLRLESATNQQADQAHGWGEGGGADKRETMPVFHLRG